MKYAVRVLLLAAFMGVIGCGGSGSNSNNSQGNETDTGPGDLFNGYILTGIDVQDDLGNSTTTISYDFSGKTIEWINYDEAGLVQFREVLFYDNNGRIVMAEDYNSSGQLEKTDTYTLVDGLISSRESSNGERLNFDYTDNNVLGSREYVRGDTGTANRRITFSHNTAGSISGSTETYYADDGTVDSEFRRSYQFNDAGQLISVEAENVGNAVENYDYDSNGNNIRRTDIDAAGVTLRQVTYSFEQTSESVVNLRARILRFFIF